MTIQLSPLPPGAPPALMDMREGVRELAQPTKPLREYACNSTDLPPAASWTYSRAWLIDLNALAVSNGTNWIRTDTGAAI